LYFTYGSGILNLIAVQQPIFIFVEKENFVVVNAMIKLIDNHLLGFQLDSVWSNYYWIFRVLRTHNNQRSGCVFNQLQAQVAFSAYHVSENLNHVWAQHDAS
jgi:hypothetical protein